MNSKVQERLGRLASHLNAPDQILNSHLPNVAQCDKDSINTEPTWSTSTSTTNHGCYNYEPGRLLLNQVAIITGAGSGIGRAAAILFAHHGAYVCVSDLDAAAAEATADFIRNSAGDRCITVVGDVTAEDFPQRCVDATVKAFGGALHILVCNAGFTWDGVVHKMKPKQWDMMLNVHCTAPFRLIQAAAPFMRDAAKTEIAAKGRAHPRSILTVSSVSGVHGNSGQSNYATAKAGIVGLTKTVAKEWGAFNIRANSLVYGHINTRLVQDKEKGASISVDGEKITLGIPQADATAGLMQQMSALGRVGTAEEAAGAMLLLACPYASYITGQAIEVTGGGWM
jgi:3-oxoacyl-[acyl-carrier protein] reductase